MLVDANVYESKVIHPKILYYGNPVVLLTTLNEDDTTNISPISSSWALGPYIILGLGIGGKAFENIQRTQECVLNLPSHNLWSHVEKLAPLTGKDPVPESKLKERFRYEKDKFGAGELTPQPSLDVRPDRVQECPLQIEAKVVNIRIPEYYPHFAMVEVEVLKVHAHSQIMKNEHHIDPSKWQPLIYNFRHYFQLGESMGKTFRAEI